MEGAVRKRHHSPEAAEAAAGHERRIMRKRRIHHGPPRDKKYLAWIRTWPCLVCRSSFEIEAAHTGDDGGMSLKSSDYSAIPLCSDCHTQAARSYHRGTKRQ